MNRPQKTPNPKNQPAKGPPSETTNLAANSLPPRRSQPRCHSADNAPRRSYTPDVPARYPHYRNHVINHLRAHLSLAEVLEARLQNFSWSHNQVTIGAKTITNRSVVDVFEAFLEVRAELAKAKPELAKPESHLFSALDGGCLFVSHRPQGMMAKGFNQFVETRNALFSFLFTKARDKDLDYLLAMNMQHVKHHTMDFRVNRTVTAEYQELLGRYLKAREFWCEQVSAFSKIVDSHGSRSRPSKLNAAIKALEAKKSPSKEQRTQLKELLKVREALDANKENRFDRQVLIRERSQNGLLASVDFEIELDPFDEELITPSIMPVYRPNLLLMFLGTDGGRLLGDV